MPVRASAASIRARAALPGDGVLIAVLFGLGLIAYVLVARSRVGPIIDNDEFIYGNVAQSIAAGDGALWRGADAGVSSLYPYLIAPAWMLADGEVAYRIAQGIGVLLACTVVWPVWLVARTVTPPRWALVAPTLALLGIWIEHAGKIMTEAVAIPVVTWSLCLAVLSLRPGRGRLLWLALGLAALAGLIRPQAGAALLVIASALSIDVLRRPRPQWRAAAAARGLALGAAWGLVALALLAATGPGRDLLGNYGAVFDLRPGLGDALAWTGDHLVEILLLAGIVPWLSAGALMVTGRAWRDGDLGPYLSVLVSAVVVFALVAGWFAAGEAGRVVERYVAYAGPLLLVAIVPALRLASWRALAAVTAGTAILVVLGRDPVERGGEATSVTAVGKRLLGWDTASGAGGSLVTLAVLVLGVGAALAAGTWLRERRAVVGGQPTSTWITVAAAAAAAALLVIPSQYAWHFDAGVSQRVRDAFTRIPDGATDGPTTLVVSGVAARYPLWIEFFNKDIDRVIVDPPATAQQFDAGYGPACRYAPRDDGRFTNDSACRDAGPREHLFVSTPVRIPTLRGGEKAQATALPFVYSTRGESRLVALRTPLCDEGSTACAPAEIVTFAERPGTLTLRFTGGQSPHQIAVNGKVSLIPAGTPVTLRVPVPAGRHATAVQGDWQALSLDVPNLDEVLLTERGRASVRIN